MTEGIVNLSDATAKRSLIARIGAMSGTYILSMKRWHPRRSNRANAFFHAAVVPALQQFLAEQGEHYTHEQIFDLMKEKFLRVTIIDKNTGEMIGTTTKGSSGLDVSEFCEFTNNCIEWLRDHFGIEIQSPESFFTPNADATASR